MCGIAGAYWNANSKPIHPKVLDCMTDILQHRGPDGRGTYYRTFDNGSGIALGHRRLAIIDLASGQQPLPNEDETLWITFNGEIYNYQALRQSLESRGHRFRTDSDTETIVHLYEDFGPQCVEHLRGMFAFAIWDARQQLVFLARDRLGQKPLVYREDSGQLLFASEIKSILQVRASREVDQDALGQFLTLGYVAHPRSMFCGIKKLPPAHFAIFQHGRLRLERYWEPSLQHESRRSLGELCEMLRAELTEAVRLRLRSDVPIGAFLSGGVDSTTIVGLMQELLPHPAKTFTMGFSEEEYDETLHARQAASHLGTDHHELQVAAASASILPTLTWHFDEPFADSSAIPTFGLAAATRKQVKVALTGDGGDELFAGYPRYQTIQRISNFDRMPKIVRSLLANPVWQLLPGSDGKNGLIAKLRFRMGILRQSADARYINWVAYFRLAMRNELLSPEFQSQLNVHPEDAFLEILQASRRSAGTRAMHCDLQTYLPGDLLTKLDITSMAHGLECRSPFLDHHVVDRSLSIPFHYHVDPAYVKPVLTRTFSDLIPERLKRRRKMGFCVPLNAWFRGPLRSFAHDLLLSGPSSQRGYFRNGFIRSLLNQHMSGNWNHGDRIWNLICLEQWHRDYVDSATPPQPLATVQDHSANSRKTFHDQTHQYNPKDQKNANLEQPPNAVSTV